MNKRFLMLMMSLSMSLSGCNNYKCNDNDEAIEKLSEETISFDIYTSLDNKNENSLINERSLRDINYYKVLKTNKLCNLYEDNTLQTQVDKACKNTIYTEYELVNGLYKINKDNNIYYIKEEDADITTKKELPYDFEKVVYLVSSTNIYGDKNLTRVKDVLPSLECCEVYEEFDNCYFIQTNDFFGYISKEKAKELTDTFVVVDISDQELKLYKDNKVVLTSPVCTGKPSSPSDQGLFKIYSISKNRYLVGPNYRTYVDVMMKYNNGEGLHDAQYHTNDDGFSHGWRNYYEFGGDTYLTNGSHGCVNMPHDEVMEVYENVEKGTKVLVKK